MELQADAKHQQDDADFRKLLCKVDVGRIARRIRPDDHSRDQVADDRRKAEALSQISADEGRGEPSGKRENEPGFRHAIAMVVRGPRSLSRTILCLHLPRQEHTGMSDHVRQHRSLLAAVEKRLLIAIAHRLPTWVHSDHLTGLAVAAMVTASAAFIYSRWDTRALWIVVAAQAVNWFGDSLDGTLARVRKVERPRYGFYLDHVLDIIGITILLGGLAASTFMSPVIALSFVVAYLLVSGEVFLATAVRGVFKMSFAGVGPTELRILLAIGAIALRNNPHVDLGEFGRFPLFDFGGLIAVAGLIVTLAVSATRNAVALARLE